MCAYATGTVAAQQAPRSGGDALATWIVAPASTGRERPFTDAIERAIPGWRRDAMGNLVMHRGSGTPRRVIACALDRFSFFVSEIDGEGYIRLHDPMGSRPSLMWDQFHEGQRIRVQTRRGPVPGVIAVRSTHLRGRRGADSSLASIDGFYVDVGARSRADVASLGIAILDPVSREWPAWSYAGHVAGPAAGARAGCAAVAAAARGTPARGETVFILSAQSELNFAGYSAALARLGRVDSVATTFGSSRGDVVHIAVTTRFDGTLAESVADSAFESLRQRVETLAGVPATGPLPPLVVEEPARLGGTDALGGVSQLLGDFTNVYSVSAHERPMHDAVMAALPAWAKTKAVTDSAGNIVLALGPDRDTALFVAHMDEIGYEVTRVNADGSVSLRTRGGFFQSLWEGQPALLHIDRGAPIKGVFVPRNSATVKQPRDVTAWFGLDSAALISRGAIVGASVTSYKRATRLGATRFTARSIDDRAGCAALILALRSIPPGAFTHKVIFAFSTREETGLEGARVLAAQFGASVTRVYAIDTFVSSDSPLESHRFAFTPIGNGAVVRAVDNSSTAGPEEVDRIVAIANAAHIPIQVGTTNGGNDGSTFVPRGAIAVPLSWPLRYSHSPAEVIDLADVGALGRLVAAIALHSEK